MAPGARGERHQLFAVRREQLMKRARSMLRKEKNFTTRVMTGTYAVSPLSGEPTQ